MTNQDADRLLLKLTAEIVSQEPEGFIIKVSNNEKNETIECQSTREYAEYIINSVNTSKYDDFVAQWKPSPAARRADIDMIGMQLGMMQEWMDKEMGIEGDENSFT
jgi:hypothetical protein